MNLGGDQENQSKLQRAVEDGNVLLLLQAGQK